MEKLLYALIMLNVFVGCSHQPDLPTAPVATSWFNIPSTYLIGITPGHSAIHPFFDLEANLRGGEEKLINYVLVSPADSSFQYDLDLPSGRIYKVRDLCGNKDLSKSYKYMIEKPNFSMGIIPRTYNQERTVQKIIIFKENIENENFLFAPEDTREARVVGSVILEHCEHYPCNSQKRWSSTQILVGVDTQDSRYGDIETLAELKLAINWPYTKAYLENQYGAHRIGHKYYSAYRVRVEYDEEQTAKFFKNTASDINIQKLLDWRKTCFNLYDSMWADILRIRSEKSNQQALFLNMFSDFYIHNYQQYSSCHKLVRPANIDKDEDRHWFFTFVSAVLKLEEIGFRYSCKDNVWLYNALHDLENLFGNGKQEFRQCKPGIFEKIFDHATNVTMVLENQVKKDLRYIEYDTKRGGTHQKLYSWIIESNQKLVCDQNNAPPEMFPRDVTWRAFKSDKIDPYLAPSK